MHTRVGCVWANICDDLRKPNLGCPLTEVHNIYSSLPKNELTNCLMLLKHLLSLSFLTYKIRIVISQIVLKIKEKIKEIVCFDNWRSLDERCVQEHRTIEKVGTLGAIVNCVTRHVNLEAWKPSVQVKKGGSREGVSKRDLLSEPLSKSTDRLFSSIS